MTETLTGTNRSNGITYTELLDRDSHPVSEILRRESPIGSGNTRVPAHAYFSKEWHDLEVERLWSRVWQFACLEDEIANVGFGIAEVERHREHLSPEGAEFLGRCVERAEVGHRRCRSRADRHLRTLGDESMGDRPSDSPARSRDERDAPLAFTHRQSLFLTRILIGVEPRSNASRSERSR